MFHIDTNNCQKGWSVIALGVILSISSLSLISSASSILPVEFDYIRIAMIAGAIVCGVFGVMMISGKEK